MLNVPIWVPFVTLILGALIAFALRELSDSWQRERVRRGHFEALSAEIRMCGAMAAGYLKSKIDSPAYRMPLIGHDSSLAVILAEGVMTQDDCDALISFYSNAKAFNLCLDYAHAAAFKDDGIMLDKQANRTRMKAKILQPGSDGVNTEYDDAIAVVRKFLPPPSLRRLHFDVAEDEKV